MSKRWAFGTPEKQIEAFIGAWGIKTGWIESREELLFRAAKLFEVPETDDAQEMADLITALGRKGRKELAHKNLETVFGDMPDLPNRKASPDQITEPALEKMMNSSQPNMVDGAGLGIEGELDIDPAQLLRKVVSAIISQGQGDILAEFPEVLAFFKSRIPDPSEVEHHHSVNAEMWERQKKWCWKECPNRQ